MARSEGTLGDWLTFKNGKTSPQRNKQGIYPVYGSNGLIGKADISNINRSAIVIGRVGSYCGSTYYSPTPAWVTDNAIIATSRHSQEDRFWFYALKYLDLHHWSHGSGQPLLNQTVLKSVPFEAPTPEERERIAATLGALDDKIESNQRKHTLLEQIAFAHYLSSSRQEHHLFEVAALTMGSSPAGSTYNNHGDGAPFYQGVADFGVRFPERRIWTTDPVRFAEPNDSLFSVRAPVGRLNRATEKCCIGRGVASVHSGFPSTIFYALVNARKEWEVYNAEGTVYGSINKKDLTALILDWPEPTSLIEVEQFLSQIDLRILALHYESKNLALLRDTLLPELMSGRIRVPEAREAVQDAIDIELPEVGDV
ncbi:restriction endonuclease subunit S [Actinotignum sp. GS-2025b]|uniref:restriction endonuclease subunit S n=1 Tax=unclassified Actinotignum TaxID=2632702 RepID=UPI00373FAC14